MSLILYGGNDGKQVRNTVPYIVRDNFPYVNDVQVYSRQLNVSMTYKNTNDLVTSIDEGYDKVVELWRDHLASNLTDVQVSD